MFRRYKTYLIYYTGKEKGVEGEFNSIAEITRKDSKILFSAESNYTISTWIEEQFNLKDVIIKNIVRIK